MMKIILAEEYISFDGIHNVPRLCQLSMFSRLFTGLVRSESTQKNTCLFLQFL